MTFEEPAPAPEGLYFTTKTSGINAEVNEANGWDLTWDATITSWRNIEFAINNYETSYDILKISITATAGTNVGIWWNYGEGLHADVRSHYSAEAIVGETGTLELVYLAKAFGIVGEIQTSVQIYFDNPTGTSTNVGEQSATINSIELLKSSEIDFAELNITADAMNVDFTGEPVEFVASSDANVNLVVEYEV